MVGTPESPGLLAPTYDSGISSTGLSSGLVSGFAADAPSSAAMCTGPSPAPPPLDSPADPVPRCAGAEFGSPDSLPDDDSPGFVPLDFDSSGFDFPTLNAVNAGVFSIRRLRFSRASKSSGGAWRFLGRGAKLSATCNRS